MKIRTLVVFFALLVTATSFAQLVNRKKDWWDISVQYPRFLSAGDVAAAANKVARRTELDEFNNFLRDAKADLPELKKMSSHSQYSLLVVPTKVLDTPTVVSGYVLREIYTAGANVNSSFTAINYARFGNKVREITLQDLFIKSVDGIGECSKAIMAHYFAQGGDMPSAILSGGWTRLDAEDAKNFAIGPDGITFLFNKYAIGAGAEGRFVLKLPYSAFMGLNKEGILKSVMKTKSANTNSTMLMGSRWLLQEIQFSDDKNLKPSQKDSCWIEFSNGSISVRAGINRLRGDVKIDSNNRLTFSNTISTKALNPAKSTESEFERFIFQAQSYLFTDNKLALVLPLDTGVMIFRKA